MSLKEQLTTLGIDLTEEQVVGAIKRISTLLVKDFTFGIHSEEDIEQECFHIALKQLYRFDLEKSKGDTILDKLESFLYVVVLSRLKNFKRDRFCKTNTPCVECYRGEPCLGPNQYCEAFKEWKLVNNAKMSVQNPYSLNVEFHASDRGQNEILVCKKSEHSFSGVDLKDMINVIRPKLTPTLQEYFDVLCRGEKLGYAKKASLLEAIHEIIGE